MIFWRMGVTRLPLCNGPAFLAYPSARGRQAGASSPRWTFVRPATHVPVSQRDTGLASGSCPRAPTGHKSVARGVSPWYRRPQHRSAPKGGKATSKSLSPLGGLTAGAAPIPGACAPGYTPSPLRGERRICRGPERARRVTPIDFQEKRITRSSGPYSKTCARFARLFFHKEPLWLRPTIRRSALASYGKTSARYARMSCPRELLWLRTTERRSALWIIH